MSYPLSLFHHGEGLYRVVHSPEEHEHFTAAGWSDNPVLGHHYRVHTAGPVLAQAEASPAGEGAPSELEAPLRRRRGRE